MAVNDFAAESPNNYEQKCLCVLALDVSGSMGNLVNGQRPIDELNQGLEDFYTDIKTDSTTSNRLEVCIIEFSSETRCIQEPALVQDFTMPTLRAWGTTRLVDGVHEAIAKVEARKEWYKKTGQPYYRPWIILITDGEPDEDQNIEGLAQTIRTGVKDKKFFFFAIGVENARMDMLKTISSPEMLPAKLQGLKFGAFFKWLSQSMTTVTRSKEGEKVDLSPGANDWMTGFKIE